MKRIRAAVLGATLVVAASCGGYSATDTNNNGAAATVNAIKALRSEGLSVRALQEYHAETPTRKA
jgi:hypothetical protein